MLGIITFPSYEIRILDIEKKEEFLLGKHFVVNSILYLEKYSLLLSVSSISIIAWNIKKKKGEITLEYEISKVIDCGNGICTVLMKNGHISIINVRKIEIVREISFSNEGLSILYNKYENTILVLQADYTISEYSANNLTLIYSFNIQDYMPNF
ncbi:MAG: hypothetical protein J1F40_01525 [Prevotellaceae bacterium]|nr:hypothetical protein [Prevotellaceae bacterium]